VKRSSAHLLTAGTLGIFTVWNEFQRPALTLPKGSLVPAARELPSGTLLEPSDDALLRALDLTGEASKALALSAVAAMLHARVLTVEQRILLALSTFGPARGHEALAALIGSERATVCFVLQGMLRQGKVVTGLRFVALPGEAGQYEGKRPLRTA
jgi:hypothetical protein